MIILTISKYIYKRAPRPLLSHAITTQGFLLLELMIGLLILIMSIMLLFSYQGLIIATQYNALKRWHAVNELHSFFAKVTFDPTLLKKQHYNHNKVTITWALDSYRIKRNHDLKKLKESVRIISYLVEWKGWGNKKEIIQGSSGALV